MKKIITSLLIAALIVIGTIAAMRHYQRAYWFKELVGRDVTTETIRGFYGKSPLDLFGPDRYCIIIEYDNDLWSFLVQKYGLVPIDRKATVPYEYQDYLQSHGYSTPEVYGTSFVTTYEDGRVIKSENPFVWHNPAEKLLSIGVGYPMEIQK